MADDRDYRNRVWPKPRARIGLIIPSVNTLTEPQFNAHAPDGVSFHVHRVRLGDKSLLEQEDDLLDAGRMLAEAGCDLIVYHCTGRTMGSGLAAEQAIVKSLEHATGRAATTTATAITNALRAIGAHSVVLVTPYPQTTNDKETRFLSQLGIRVLRDRALDLPVPQGMCGATPEVWMEVTLAERDPEADAYFLSCTNIQSIATIEPLEAKLGKPVVTSNQAALWYVLRRCGVMDALPGLGRLMALPLPERAGDVPEAQSAA